MGAFPAILICRQHSRSFIREIMAAVVFQGAKGLRGFPGFPVRHFLIFLQRGGGGRN